MLGCVLLHQLQDIDNCLVQSFHRKASIRDPVDDPFAANTGITRHFQIQSSLQACNSILHGAPVGHDKAVKSPFLTKHICQQPPVFRTVRTIDLVIGTHHGSRPSFFDNIFKHFQINLPNCPHIRDRVSHEPVIFAVVQCKVLDGYTNALTLNALDLRCSHFACQQRIFRKIFKISPAQGIPFNVGTGSKQNTHSVMLAFICDGLSHLIGVIRVP